MSGGKDRRDPARFQNMATTPVRQALDKIRRELGMERQKNPCLHCGDERWENGRPVEHCETCQGKKVAAANLLRAILGHARDGLVPRRLPIGLGQDWAGEHKDDARREAGIVESTPPPREMGG